MENLSFLPNWKKNATAEERFSELSIIARKHPERFRRFTIVYEETFADGSTQLRHLTEGQETLNEMLGLLALASITVLEDARKGR